ncbi:MAG: amidohydrolase [Phycisphaerales bacterium]|nr:amidohydrolase [Phycisphaerales bacterium]
MTIPSNADGQGDLEERLDPNNRFGVDFRAQALALGAPPCPIIDAHAHIGGDQAASLYLEVADLHGIEQVFSMTRLEEVPRVREILGDRVHFIAVPDWYAEDRRHAQGAGFLESIERFHGLGARMIKFFQAPRTRDLEREVGEPGMLDLDGPIRMEQARLAESLGMGIMTHVADPDTWFEAKYRDASLYGTKAEQYVPLERMLDRFDLPWIAAHMGGSPEDLDHLDGLLERHPNLHLDTSACKWMIRELGGHQTEDVRGFFRKWRGRLLFGSDIVSMESHLDRTPGASPMGAKASGRSEAFDLYASRYWALRSMFESSGTYDSPIVDPDLHMVDPENHGPDDAPTVRCHAFEQADLEMLYRGSVTGLMRRIGLG